MVGRSVRGIWPQRETEPATIRCDSGTAGAGPEHVAWRDSKGENLVGWIGIRRKAQRLFHSQKGIVLASAVRPRLLRMRDPNEASVIDGWMLLQMGDRDGFRRRVERLQFSNR